MSKNSKGSNKLTVVIVIVLLVLAVGGVAYTLSKPKGAPSSQQETSYYKDPTTGLSVNYSGDLKLVPYVPPREDSVLFNLTKADPKILVTAWYKEAEKSKALNLEDIISKLDETYKEVNVTSQKPVTINGHDGGEVIFTHVSAGLPTTQRLTVLAKDDKTSVTIACQSLTSDFETINNQYFNEIISSAKFE